jgi:N-methylhydantoinase A
VAPVPRQAPRAPSGRRRVFDPGCGDFVEARVFRRPDLAPGTCIEGPALILEDETTTVVPPNFEAAVNALGYLVLEPMQALRQEPSP